MPLNLQQHSLACLNHRSVNRHKSLGHVAFGLKDTKIDLFCTIQTGVCSSYLNLTLCVNHYSFISIKREASILLLILDTLRGAPYFAQMVSTPL